GTTIGAASAANLSGLNRPGARRRCRRRKVDEHVSVLRLGPERLEIDEAGRLPRLAGAHVERAEVQAAFDHVTLQDAVGEVGGGVGAARLGGVEGAVDIVDRHQLVADLEALDGAGRQIGGGTNRKYCCGHDLIDAVDDGCALASLRKSSIGKGAGQSIGVGGPADLTPFWASMYVRPLPRPSKPSRPKSEAEANVRPLLYRR